MSVPYYPQSRYTVNLGLSLFGMDEVLAENFVILDTAVGSGGGGSSTIKVNGSVVTNPNFNDTTPAAPLGFTNVLWQKDGSGNVSAYVPTSGGGGTVTGGPFAPGNIVIGNGGQAIQDSGVALSSLSGGPFVKLNPTADQTITGAHALILSDPNSTLSAGGVLLVTSTGNNTTGNVIFGTTNGIFNPVAGSINFLPLYGAGATQYGTYGYTEYNGVQTGRPVGNYFGAQLEPGASCTDILFGLAGYAENDENTIVTPWIVGVWADAPFTVGSNTQNQASIWVEAPHQNGTNTPNCFAAYWPDAGAGGPFTNTYYTWMDSQGVRRIKEDNKFNSVGQAIEALYNPLFTKYTPGAANFERVILGQWSSNVAQIGNEAGGTGTLRKVQIIGAGLLVPDVEIQGSSSGSATIQVAAAAGTPNPLQLPTTTGTAGQVLSTDGNNPQQLSWVNQSTPTVATVHLTGQTASIGSTTLYAVTPSDTISISYYLKITAAGSISGSVTLTLGWTDRDDSTVLSVVIPTPANAVDTTGVVSGTLVVDAKTGTNITYLTTYASSGGTAMVYKLSLKAEAL